MKRFEIPLDPRPIVVLKLIEPGLYRVIRCESKEFEKGRLVAAEKRKERDDVERAIGRSRSIRRRACAAATDSN